jgi:hypothetical protein
MPQSWAITRDSTKEEAGSEPRHPDGCGARHSLGSRERPGRMTGSLGSGGITQGRSAGSAPRRAPSRPYHAAPSRRDGTLELVIPDREGRESPATVTVGDSESRRTRKALDRRQRRPANPPTFGLRVCRESYRLVSSCVFGCCRARRGCDSLPVPWPRVPFRCVPLGCIAVASPADVGPSAPGC